MTETNVSPVPDNSLVLAKNVPTEQKPTVQQLFAVMDIVVKDYTHTGTVYGHSTRRPGTCASCCEDTIALRGTPRQQMQQYEEYCKLPVEDEYHGGRGYPRRSMYGNFNKSAVISAALQYVYPLNPMLYLAANDILSGKEGGLFITNLVSDGYVIGEAKK